MITEAIDFKKELESAKKRISYESKTLKSFGLYNYLNDGRSNLILDCRYIKSSEDKQDCILRGCYLFQEFNGIKNFKFENTVRLILILNKDQNLKEDNELEELRSLIKSTSEIKEIFTIQEDFNAFQSKYSFFFLKKDSTENLKQIAYLKYPFMIVENLLFCGNFFNSRNLTQIELLGIKSIIGLMKEEDLELKKKFNNYNFFEVDEANHSEIEIREILDLIDIEIEAGNIPIMLYCFSGQASSLIVAVAYLIKTKKWNINFATAYIMKLCNVNNFQSWLYTQLNRIDFKK
jgi:hypothetical protein